MKKRYIAIGAIVLAGSILFIQPVRSLAESALSIFRVENTKTIDITMTDIEELMSASQDLSATKADISEAELKEFVQLQKANNEPKAEIKTLDNIQQFDSFDVSLPEAFAAQTPELKMLPSQTNRLTADTDLINKMAAAAGLTGTLDEAYDQETLSITTSPILMASYDNISLLATQGYRLDSPGALGQDLWNMLLTQPNIPENLRAQLQEVDISGSTIYLPVVMGVGREVDLGTDTGYIYASADFAALANTLGERFASEATAQAQIAPEGEYNSLIWVHDNVLYVLSGSVSDDELVKIARSVK